MQESREKKVPLRLDPELWKAARTKMVADDVAGFQSLLTGLISNWIKGGVEVAAKPTDGAHGKLHSASTANEHRKLEEILTKGTKKQIDGIVSNLDAFVAQIKYDEMVRADQGVESLPASPRRRAKAG